MLFHLSGFYLNAPRMSSLVNTFSFYMFSLLGFEEERLRDWLVLPPEVWQTQSYYKRFKEFAQTLVVTNDHCERSVAMMQQFVHRCFKEEEKQERLLAVDLTRHAIKSPGSSSTKQSKKRIKKALSTLRDQTNVK